MIKIEFPANRTDIARAVATMLNTIANEAALDDLPLVRKVKNAQRIADEKTAQKIDDAAFEADLNPDTPADVVREVLAHQGIAGKVAEGLQREQKTAAELTELMPDTATVPNFEEIAAGAICDADEMAEVSNEDAAVMGANLAQVYAQHGPVCVSISVLREVLAESSDPAFILSDCAAILETIRQDTAVGADVKLDDHGVPFNGEMCGKAAIPFYGSGKNKGKWKKKVGVSAEDWQAWHAAAMPASTAQEQIQKIADTSTAFGGQTEQAADLPTDANALMVWISERQAAGTITNEQVTAAYADNNVAHVGVLFGMTPEAGREAVQKIAASLA